MNYIETTNAVSTEPNTLSGLETSASKGAVADIGLDQEKRQHGVYYTPFEVASLMAMWAIKSKTDEVLEPSFGGCAFLEASIKQLTAIGCKTPRKQLCGFDIDPEAFRHLAKLDPQLCASGNRFVQKDFLLANLEDLGGGKVDVIVGNPPFVSYRRMNVLQRDNLARWLLQNTSVTQKDASLWAYFIQHSLSFLKEGGRMAWILPASLLFVQYGEELCELLGRHFEKNIFVDLQQQLFINSGTRERTVLVLSENFSATARSTRADSKILRFTRFSEAKSYFEAPEKISKEKVKSCIRHFDPVDESIELISDVLSRTLYLSFGEISKILIGDVMGDSSFFVKTKEEWKSLSIPERELFPIITKSSQLSGLSIDDVALEELIKSGERVLLFRPFPENLSKAAQAYIRSYPEMRRNSNSTFSRRQFWYRCSYENGADLFFPSLTTVGSRFIVNSSRVACANALYRIHLNEDWKGARFAIAIYSVSTLAQLLAEVIGGGMGEGALKLNPLHLKQLPIPAEIYGMAAGALPTFVKIDNMIAVGQVDEARNLADAWLSRIMEDQDLARAKELLISVRKRRREYDIRA